MRPEGNLRKRHTRHSPVLLGVTDSPQSSRLESMTCFERIVEPAGDGILTVW